jgi:chemotaxis protein MotB
MKRSATRSRRRSSAVLLPLALAACVSRGAYQEVEAERDALTAEKQQLEERITLLEASTESLGVERVALIDEMETLREAHSILDRDVRGLRSAKTELSESLQAREAELAARNQEVEQLRGTYEGLVADLESEVAAGQIEISQLRQGLQLNLTQDVLFASGSAELNEAGRSVLAKVAQRLNEVPHRIEVRGHTDSVPIRGPLAAKFPSNWELAGARASGVVRFLAEHKIDPTRLVSVSHGQYDPIAPNDTPEGRQKNRRIGITLEPKRPDPATASAAPQPPGTPAAPPPAPTETPAAP